MKLKVLKVKSKAIMATFSSEMSSNEVTSGETDLLSESEVQTSEDSSKQEKSSKRKWNHEKPKLFSCDLCPRQYKYKKSVGFHKRCVHSGESVKNNIFRFKCPYENCGRAFSRMSGLNNHLITHTGEKSHECFFCPMAFRRSSYLVRHMRVHTGEKPYPCIVSGCSMWFARKDVALAHYWSHHPQGPQSTEPGGSHLQGINASKPLRRIPCSFCGKGFYRSGLENHIRTHTNEKPFKCQVCSYETKEAGTLKQHIARVHGDKGPPLTCPICYGKTNNWKFKSQMNLRNHMRIAHKTRQKSDFTQCALCHKKIITNGMSHVYRLIAHYKIKHKIDLFAQVLLVRNSPSDVYYQ